MQPGTGHRKQFPMVKSRRRRAGGRGRSAALPAAQQVGTRPVRKVPTYDLLGPVDLKQIEDHADWLLEQVGMEFRGDQQALTLFSDAGALIDGERVRFPDGMARQLCTKAPSSFWLKARNPHRDVKLGGDGVVFMPGYGSPFVTDLEKGRRYATIEDFDNFIKLAQHLPQLHHSGGTVVEPTDLPVNKRHLHMVRSHLVLSDKPFMGGVTSLQAARDSIAMARLVFGASFLERYAVIQANININSPFVFDETMSGVLREYAAAGQCVCISPAIFGGAMGPVTPAAIAAQTLAEAMTGIALTQLVKPGCPVVLGSFHSTMNLRTGSLTFGTPEANLVSAALVQLGNRLGVPVRGGGGQITAANLADGQAMQDSANSMWSSVLTGSHQVWHAAGWLEGGLTMSYEKFVLDADNCGALLRFLEGMEVSAQTLSRDSYLEVEPGGNFLSTSHTIERFATANYESLLPDSGPFETWKEKGSQTAEQRAHLRWKQLLDDYRLPEMNTNKLAELNAFVAERDAQLADKWH